MNETQDLHLTAGGAGARRWGVPVFFAVWTLLAAGVAWWLVHSAGKGRVEPQMLFDASHTAQVPVGEQIRRWLRIADLNFRGAYPWLLLAPYVIWLSSRFLLERGRLRLSLPVHLFAGGLFAAGSYALSSRTMEQMSVRMVVTDHREMRRLGPESAPGLLPSDAPWQGDVSTAEMAPNRAGAFASHSASGRAKIVLSSGGDVQTFDLPLPTNSTVLTGGLGQASGWLSNWTTVAGTGVFPRLPFGEPAAGSVGGTGGGGFAALHSAWRYESHLFSHVLNVLAYGSLAGLAHAVHFYRRSRERERRAVLLESHLAKARLQALQAQLQPHFLFNALNAVATLLRRDARAAQEALTSFSELLRLALSQSDKQEVSLREDLEFVERYVEIQQTRLGDRFRFEQEIEPAALNCLVPTLLLQPLVENALRHGIEMSSQPGWVRITAQRQGRRLTLSIEDNGVGLEQEKDRTGTGIGLANLRARLEALYGNEHRVELVARAAGGVVVRLEIPLRDLP